MTAASVPETSLLYASSRDAYFCDAYAGTLHSDKETALELFLAASAHVPGWIDAMMRFRNSLVSKFGLKDLGTMGGIDQKRTCSDYKVGDRVGIFSIIALTEQELVLGDNDKHLKAEVSIFKDAAQGRNVTVSTVVHVHNFWGRLYLFFVVPAHKIIAPAMLKTIIAANR